MKEPKTREILDKNIDLLEKRMDGIIDYIRNNPNSDPNAYEMNDIMFAYADIGFFWKKVRC